MRIALVDGFGPADGQTRFGEYTSARKILIDDVYDEIRGAEPFLTDHGRDHIRNVLDNVEYLLGLQPTYFKPIEMYILGLSVLFHDVGNLDGREGHNKRIGIYYDRARPGHPERYVTEKRLVINAAQAHTGKCREGTRNTLRDVEEIAHLSGEPVRLREIAAVVRLADELAEGLQRTSLFLLSEKKIPRDSELHHRYAASTSVAIDPNMRRISLTYNIIFDKLGDDLAKRFQSLTELLKYIHHRVAKLDDERKYARFYCAELLAPFRQTSVYVGIWAHGELLDLGLNESIILSDLVVPEGKSSALRQIEAAYDPQVFIERILRKFPGHSPSPATLPSPDIAASALPPVQTPAIDVSASAATAPAAIPGAELAKPVSEIGDASRGAGPNAHDDDTRGAG